MPEGLNMSRRIRRTPYTDRVEAAGVTGFSVVNHMLLPKAFQRTVEEDYWHLREHVQIWDVSCQRQVCIAGPDAERLVQLMTPRKVTGAKVGQCLYIPIVDHAGGLINDPVLLKIAPTTFWLSIADSDVLLYALGLATGYNLDVDVSEPDVHPLAIQGPKAEDLLASLFGDHIREIGFFRFGHFDFQGTRQLIARSGYSRQGGFEIYLDDSALGGALWDAIWQAGAAYNIAPGCPNLIERIEGGLFSYGNEMTRVNNPFEIGLGKYLCLDGSIDCVGINALRVIAEEGPHQEIRGVQFDGAPCPTCAIPWPVIADNSTQIGQITSAICSPRLKRNIGLSMISKEYWDPGTKVTVLTSDGLARSGTISNLPFA